MSDDNQPISVPVDREEIARLQRQEQARYDRERLMFVADRGEDDGYWYVRDLNEMCRPASHRAESVALIADQWPDGGEEAAKVITNALNKHYAERSE